TVRRGTRWCEVASRYPLTIGRREWAVRIEIPADAENWNRRFLIGVCSLPPPNLKLKDGESTFNERARYAVTHKGRALTNKWNGSYSEFPRLYPAGVWPEPFPVSGTVTVTVDIQSNTKNSISFGVDGKCFGVAFENIVDLQDYIPFVGL